MKIRSIKPKSSTNNYRFLFDSNEIGNLITKIHSAVIRLGNELEKGINAQLTIYDQIEETLKNKSWFCLKPSSLCKKLHVLTCQPDFIFVNHKEKVVSVVEIKLGDNFDTKKSKGEIVSLKTSTNELKKYFKTHNLDYQTNYYFCSFFAKSKKQIISGSKKRFDVNNVLTGHEFCQKFSIDFNQVLKKIGLDKSDQNDNLLFLIEELFKVKTFYCETEKYFQKIYSNKK